MYLSTGAVREIADSARIYLSTTALEETTRELNIIIESLDAITHFDLEGVEPTFHPIAGLSNVMREDLEEPGFTQEEAVAQAHASQEGQFKIPPILADGGGSR